MIKQHSLTYLFLVTFIFSATSQTDIYKPLLSEGQVPKEFTLNYNEIYKRIQNTVDLENKGFSKKEIHIILSAMSQEEFEFLSNGKAVFGDPISQKVNLIFNRLKNTDKSFDNLRIVVSREGSKVYMIGGDIIAVPIEVIAQISSENQLAFLIAMEMIKFKEHTTEKQLLSYATKVNRYYKSFFFTLENLQAKLGLFQENTQENYNFTLQNALKVITQANYDLEELAYVYTVLEYINYPIKQANYSFSEYVGSPLEVETKDIIQHLPQKDTFYYKRQVISPYIETEYMFENKIFPIKYEILGIELSNLIKQSSFEKRSNTSTAISKDDFKKMVELCLIETIAIDLKSGDFHKALYNTNILLETNPNARYLRVFKAQALLLLAQFRLNTMYDEAQINSNYTDLVNAYTHLTPEQKGAIALKYIYENYTLFPDDKQTKKQVDNIIVFLTKAEKIDVETKFTATKYARVFDMMEISEPIEKEEIEMDENKELSKVDKIKKAKMEAKPIVPQTDEALLFELNHFHLNYFGKMLADTSFMKLVKNPAKINKKSRFNTEEIPHMDNKIILGKEGVLVSVHKGYFHVFRWDLFFKSKPKKTTKGIAKTAKKLEKINGKLANHNLTISIPDSSISNGISVDFINTRYVENLLISDKVHTRNVYNDNKTVIQYLHHSNVYAPNTVYNFTSEYFSQYKYIVGQEFIMTPSTNKYLIPFTILVFPTAVMIPFILAPIQTGDSYFYDLSKDDITHIHSKAIKAHSFNMGRIHVNNLFQYFHYNSF